MAKWHLRSNKKSSGGLLRASKKKKRRERGGEDYYVCVGKLRKSKKIGFGNKQKLCLFSDNVVNAFDPKTKTSKKVKIMTVLENTANPHYVQRNIVTKGAVVQTELGKVKITSRPGQDGILNGIVIG
ncbi:MAG: 30S ribosomal protein S8e [Candidatus Thermoplasmatota archaeon]